MIKFSEGDIVKLSNAKSYMITKIVSVATGKYALLVTSDDPVEVLFAEIISQQDNDSLRIITENQEKNTILNLFAGQTGN